MKLFIQIVAAIFMCIHSANAFGMLASSSKTSSTALSMANPNEELMRFARQSRQAGNDDNVVELTRPLGLVLNQDDDGNVYVETVAPRGNAARTGKVKEGDIVTMCSATFGDDMWSTRGVGLTRVLAAIRVRAGPNVKLVFESQSQYERKAAKTSKQAKAAEEARLAAQAKKDQLLDELEQDEKRLKKGKFLGLF
jgi:C-terminal processing protease CtpA/Prc